MTARLIRVHSKNNHFQRVEALKRSREKRTRYGEFVLEGVRVINAALAHGWQIVSFLYSAERRLSGWGRGVLDRSPAQYHLELAPGLIEQLSDKEETSELLAVVRCAEDDFSRIPRSPTMLVVLFDRPASPGNLGSSIRSCDALGAAGAIITGHAVDLYDPAVMRASMGSALALPVVRKPSAAAVREWLDELKGEGITLKIIGADERGSVPLDRCVLTGAALLIMGNEAAGLAQNCREMCTELAHIPMCGSASSLNVSCAASIFLYEAQRQRGQFE